MRYLVQMTPGFRLVVAERIEVVGLVQKALDRRAGNHFIGRGQQDRLTHLMVPGPHADSKAFVAIENRRRRG